MNSSVMIGDTTVYPACGIMGSLEILNKHGSTGSVEIGDTQKFDTSIDENLDKDGDPTSIFSKVIGQELSHGSSSNIYLRCQMDFTSNVVRTEAPNFVNLGFLSANALDELRYFVNPATKFRSTIDGSHWSAPDHFLEKLQRLE